MVRILWSSAWRSFLSADLSFTGKMGNENSVSRSSICFEMLLIVNTRSSLAICFPESHTAAVARIPACAQAYRHTSIKSNQIMTYQIYLFGNQP